MCEVMSCEIRPAQKMCTFSVFIFELKSLHRAFKEYTTWTSICTTESTLKNSKMSYVCQVIDIMHSFY